MSSAKLIARAVLPLAAFAASITTARAQTPAIVPTDGQRGTVVYAGFPPDYWTDSESMTETFEPFRNEDSGHFELPVGELWWSAAHRSTVTGSRLLACGDVDSYINFANQGVAEAYILSLFQVEFELTRAATVRLRGTIGSQRHVSDFVGDWDTQIAVSLTSSSAVLLDLNYNNEDTVVHFDHEMALPAGPHRLDAVAQLYAGDFYAAADSSSRANYRVVLALVDCPSDVNGDGRVDLEDLAVVLANFGARSTCDATADLDLDGDVDIVDLAALLGDLGTSCNQ